MVGLFDPSLHDPADDRDVKVGADHPETAVVAARGMRLKAGSQRQRIVAEAARHGQVGITAAEAAVAIDSSRNQTAARMLELRELGWLEYLVEEGDYVDRATDTKGNRGRVHVLTAQGAAELRALA